MEAQQVTTRRKQPIFHVPPKPNEILVTRKKHFAIYIKRMHTLLFNVDKKDKKLINTFDTIYLIACGATI